MCRAKYKTLLEKCLQGLKCLSLKVLQQALNNHVVSQSISNWKRLNSILINFEQIQREYRPDIISLNWNTFK